MEYLQDFNNELFIILISMAPVIELRGAIPIGISMGMPPIKSMLLSIFGNMLVVPIIIYVLNPIMDILEATNFFSSIIGCLKKRSVNKAHLIKKYRSLGLLIFVSIPIPTTGAWTGALVSKILKIKETRAILMIWLGIILAGILVTVLSYGLKSLFIFS